MQQQQQVFGAAQFSCPPDCRTSEGLFDAIIYRADMGNKFPGRYFFWGPYAELPAGVHLFTLGGALAGELTLDFACNEGKSSLKTVVVTDLSEPVCLVLMNPVRDLELRGVKTAALREFTLSSLSVTCAYAATEA